MKRPITGTMAGTLLLAGSFLLGGCATEVAERREIIGESIETSCPGVYRTRVVRRIEPVAEQTIIRRSTLRADCAPWRTYDPIRQSWVSPAPYGPYSSTLRN